jgi:FkbM family methyltransferase
MSSPQAKAWLTRKHDKGKMHEPTFAYVLLALVGRLKPQTYFDLGALLGYFTLIPAAARPSMQVHAFEMNPDSFAAMQRNLVLNPELAPSIHLANTAISSSTALGRNIWFRDMDLKMQATDGYRQATLDVVSLDYLYTDKGLVPELMKIDVEGYEAPIISGGGRLLREKMPTLIYELHDDARLAPHGASRKSVTRSLMDFGYQIFALNARRGKSVSARPLIAVTSLEHPAIGLQRNNSFVAVAKARLPAVQTLIA